MPYGPASFKTVRVNATADGDNTLVADPGDGFRIVVLSYYFRVIGTGDATFRSGSAGTIWFVEAGLAAPGARVQWNGSLEAPAFVGDASEALVVNTAASQDVAGHLTYVVATNP
jgi:hypothetical protein